MSIWTLLSYVVTMVSCIGAAMGEGPSAMPVFVGLTAGTLFATGVAMNGVRRPVV